jgi:uncharacterized protein (TIGR03083 family)
VSLDRDQLIGIAHAERQRLGRMIQFADASTWEQPSAADGWWNIDVMAHLAAADTAAAQLLAGEPAAELDEFREKVGVEGFSIDGLNAWTVNRRSGLPVRDVLQTWGAAADSLLASCSGLTDDEWASNRYAWIAGDIAARDLLQSRIVEWFLHGEDMRATNGVSTRWQLAWQHWPVHLTIDMAVRMLPWALTRAGLDLAGRSVQIEVSGAGEGTWHWGLGQGDVPSPRKTPDAQIRGRAPQLALVAGQRLSPDAVLDAGTIVLAGDRRLADTVVRHLRAYP